MSIYKIANSNDKNIMPKMSINVFKKHPGNKITFSNRGILSGELKIMGSRPKVIFCVHGSRKCRM